MPASLATGSQGYPASVLPLPLGQPNNKKKKVPIGHPAYTTLYMRDIDKETKSGHPAGAKWSQNEMFRLPL